MGTSCECYLRRGVVYIPTLVQIGPGGHHRQVEPISVIPVDQTPELLSAVRKRMTGVEKVLRPDNPVLQISRGVYELAGLKSWAPFNRTAQNWTLSFHDGIYEIQGFRLARGGAWLPDPEQHDILPADTTIDAACAQMIRTMELADSRSRQ
jgi:hypothetical protein